MGEQYIDTGLNQIGTIGKDSEATRVYDTTCARTIKDGCGMGAKTGLYQVTKDDGTAYCHDAHNSQAVEIKVKSVAHRTRTYANQPARIEERDDNVSNALNSATKDSMVKINTSIRRLTPTECERLQGFPDGWTEGQSDTQRYKQLGNAVSVPVVKAVAERLKREKKVESN